MKQYQKNQYVRNETTSNETVSRKTISKKQYFASNLMNDDQKRKVFCLSN
jgi:hypothetical protein